MMDSINKFGIVDVTSTCARALLRAKDVLLLTFQYGYTNHICKNLLTCQNTYLDSSGRDAGWKKKQRYQP